MALWLTFSKPADYCGDDFFRMPVFVEGATFTRLCCVGVVPLDYLRLRWLFFVSCFLMGLSCFSFMNCFLLGKSFTSVFETAPLKLANSILTIELFVDRFEVTPVKETSSNGWYGCWAIDYFLTLFGGYSPEKWRRPILLRGCHTITDPAVSLV